MNQDLFFRIALTRVPQIGDVHARSLIQLFGTAEKVFHAPRRLLEKTEGIGPLRANNIKRFSAFADSEKEINFILKHNIQAINFDEEQFPKRLLTAYDCPSLLYYKGKADLNPSKSIAIVGTRNQTEYGKQLCEELIQNLQRTQALIISGLALGIDSSAHRAALQAGLPTVAALAHGLDKLYPHQNRQLAIEMLKNGGLISDFPSGTAADKQNFPRRNRIVAGMCDCLVVIQSGEKGGSLITADLANDYHKDVFAFPGRVNDPLSAGCHQLVMRHKAELITSYEDLMERMGWNDEVVGSKKKERIPELFDQLNHDQEKIIRLLQEKDRHIDEILLNTSFSTGKLAAEFLSLEMMGHIFSLPGKRYSVVNF